VDLLRRRRLANRFPGAVQISARDGEGLDALRARVAERFAKRLRAVRLLVPYDQGKVLAELYELGAPIEERLDTAEGVVVVARLPQREVTRFAQYLRAEPAARARSR
jgi:GTP-binding protein HflX